MKKGTTGLLFFALFWTAMVGAVDGIIGYNLFRQIRSQSFATTAGTVTSSEVTQHRGSKGGNTYGVKIQYTYDVGGQTFEGDRYRYGSFSSSDSGWARAAVRERPAGAKTTVHFDPKNPADSVLRTGVEGSDLFILLFLTPFNLIMLALWAVPVNWLWRKLRPSEAGGAKWFSDGRSLRVRLPRYSPWIAGAATAGAVSFISIFPLAFTVGGHPNLRLALGVWALVFAAGIGVGLWQWNKQRGGSADLVIDELEQRVELPATFGRKQREALSAAEISGITVERVERRGRRGSVSYVYAVTLQRPGLGGEKLTEWSNEDDAEALAAWLREKLRFTEPDAPPRKKSNAAPAGA